MLTHPNTKTVFNEIYIILNKILDKYDNFLLAQDLNELKPISDSSNHFLMLRMSLILQTWLIKLTRFKSEDGTLIDLIWQVDRKLKLNFLETLK